MYQETPAGSQSYRLTNPSALENGNRRDADDGSFELNPDSNASHGRGFFLAFLGLFALFGVFSMAGFDKSVKTVLRQNNIPVVSSEWDDDGILPTNSIQPIEVEGSRKDDDVHTEDVQTIVSKSIGPTINLKFAASNEYGVFSAPYPWLEETEGAQLIEPYKPTTLTLSEDISSNYNVEWRIESLGVTVFGNPVIVTVNSTGIFDIIVTANDKINGEMAGSFSTILISKYVKRELRALTIADRERFLDAAAVLWKLSDVEGRARYGPQYTSVASFVVEHAQASGDIQCDQFHEGSGFLTHHLALTNSFDAALRAVDPAVTLPYWDFTIEGQAIQNADGLPSMFMDISPFLSDTWFGEADSNGNLINSRWKDMTAPRISDVTDEQVFTVQPNSYGYIRSYWNNNNDPRVKRILFSVCGVEPVNKHVPACSDHYDVLNTETLGDFQTLSPSDGHGPMHVFLGGVGGDCVSAYSSFVDRWHDVLYADMDEDEIESLGFSPQMFMYSREATRLNILQRDVYGEYFHIWRSLWRSHMCARDDTANLLECPESCDVETTPLADCGCKVNALLDNRTDWENVYYCVLSPQNRAIFDAVMPSALVQDLVTTIATTSTIEGEMMESASPADILFWLIHPAIDRLLSAKRLPGVTTIGDTTFTKWASVTGVNEDWYEYSYYSLKNGDNAAFPEKYTCIGHSADDNVLPDRVVYLPGFAEFADANSDGKISNWEYFLAVDPNLRDGVDFVYDNFVWDHCVDKIQSSQPSSAPNPNGGGGAIGGNNNNIGGSSSSIGNKGGGIGGGGGGNANMNGPPSSGGNGGGGGGKSGGSGGGNGGGGSKNGNNNGNGNGKGGGNSGAHGGGQ